MALAGVPARVVPLAGDAKYIIEFPSTLKKLQFINPYESRKDFYLAIKAFPQIHGECWPSSNNGNSASPAPSTPGVPPAEFTVCVLPVVSCQGEMKTEPTTVTVTADGSTFLNALTWSNWGAATAHGSGVLNVNDCQPSWAQGTFTKYPVTIAFTDLTPYGNGLRAYASMTVAAPSDSYKEVFNASLVP